MKSLAIIGGSKNFDEYLLKTLKTLGVEIKLFTKLMIKKEEYYDYVVFNFNDNIRNLVLNSSYCFMNMDLIGNTNTNITVYGNIITYGLGIKNTVTVSSIENENSFVYCLQRDVNHNVLGMLEPEELPINMGFNNDDQLYALMVAITMSLIEGKFVRKKSLCKKITILN